MAVLGMHSPTDSAGSGMLKPLDAAMHRYGWTGVDLFFVLSGVLIGGLLFAEVQQHGKLEVGRFLLRRGLRIWPSYYLLLLYLFVSTAVDPQRGLRGAWESCWPALANIQNFFTAPRDHLWSLAVEEHFYALLPLFLLWAIRKGDAKSSIRAIPIAAAVVCGGSIALRTWLVATGRAHGRYPTYMCLDALFFGVYLAYLRAYWPMALAAITRRKWTLPLGFLLIAPAGLPYPMLLYTIGYTSIYLGYALILLHVVHTRIGDGWLGRLLGSPPARAVGFIGMSSYSIYLWHQDAGWLAFRAARWLTSVADLRVELRWLLSALAFGLAGVVSGVVMDKLFEQPIQRLRAKLVPTRASAPKQSPPKQPALERSSEVA